MNNIKTMIKVITKLWWRLQLTYWLMHYGYVRHPVYAFRRTGAEEWLMYYEEGYTANDTIWKDIRCGSYGEVEE